MEIDECQQKELAVEDELLYNPSMIRSLRFWQLAPLQLILYVFLIWVGCPYKPTWVTWVKSPSAIEGEEAGGVGSLVFEWLDLSDQPCLEQLAIGLNAPAAFVGGLFASSISWAAKEQLSGAKQELLSHGFAGIVIPFLWLSVGKAIERRREDAPRRSSSWLRVSAIIALVFLCLVAVLVIVSFFLPGGQPLYLLKILIFAWIVAGVQILVRPGLNCALDNER